ncbi:MAG TPA: NAD(P)H-binding protein [Thermoleophilaceae bacterium]|nr:NAD(P)H-binding protein [Thermoleophilaceae bacterium]
MARVLIVGCGCRGGELAAALRERGHAVRGTTRDEAELARIEAAGAEAVVADPFRLATLTPKLEGVSVLCWLLGSARGEADELAALHGTRLETLLETLVDTHVRGVVYEGTGSVPRDLLQNAAELVRRAHETYLMPAEILTHDPSDHAGWVSEAAAAVERVLTA